MTQQQVPVIAFTNRKGGVGKSTQSVHVAAGLAARGLRVCIIDTDTQGSVAALLNMPEEDGLYGALVRKTPLDQIVRVVPKAHYIPADSQEQATGELFLLPSGAHTFNIAYELQSHEQLFAFLRLTDALKTWLNLDAIIVDTSPSISSFDSSIYMSVDGFVYVTECERLSIDGVRTALQQLENFVQYRQQYLNRTSGVIGILPNKFRAKTNVHTLNLQDMAQGLPAGLVWSPIMLRTVWTEATNLSELIYTYQPTGAAALEAWVVVDRIEKVVQAWRSTTAVNA